MRIHDLPEEILATVRRGTVIPAHPLALDGQGHLDTQCQRALTRYYLDAGVGGIAIGVHTTQFEIRDPQIGLFEPVLSLAAETIDRWCEKNGRQILKVAGVCGQTPQAAREAEFARSQGYHTCLLSLAALAEEDTPAMVEHCRQIAQIMPITGFYLQPAVGGRVLPYEFWREFFEIENLLAVKIAPFNRYQTLDVVRALCESGREKEVALYTGNDDNIVIDLLTEYAVETSTGLKRARIVGGLLGHWAVWTKRAVELVEEVRAIRENHESVPPELLTRAVRITDSNAAFFDAANRFAGCIAGLHEVLQRQGLMRETRCLNPSETLSPGQAAEIDRVYRDYPSLNDDAFVQENLPRWLKKEIGSG